MNESSLRNYGDVPDLLKRLVFQDLHGGDENSALEMKLVVVTAFGGAEISSDCVPFNEPGTRPKLLASN